MAGRLAGRKAIVTGAARGIGLACAQRLAAEGADVLLVDIDAEAGAAAARALAASGAKAAFHAADLARPGAAAEVVAAAEGALGGADILVNNAGIAPRADFFELTLEDFDRVMAINLKAPLLLTQALARRLRARGRGGAVVNLSSINALLNGPDSLAYCVSKGALNQLTRNCAVALAAYGIRVNAVAPGTVETEMAASFGLTGAGADAARSRTPMRRLGQPRGDRGGGRLPRQRRGLLRHRPDRLRRRRPAGVELQLAGRRLMTRRPPRCATIPSTLRISHSNQGGMPVTPACNRCASACRATAMVA